jgi:uncharacterized protein
LLVGLIPARLSNNKTKSTVTRLFSLEVNVLLACFYYVKFVPYYAKAFVAYNQHSIGDSIIFGKSAVAPAVSLSSAIDYAFAYSKSIWKAMVLGLLLGSGLKILLPSRWVSSLLGRIGFKSMMLGSLFALPSMMCTCCAGPVAAGMRQSRASVGSVVSWWLANPLLNPATLVFMGCILGWGWALFRLIAGMLMVFGLAYFAERYANPMRDDAITVEALNQQLAVETGVSNDHVLMRWIQEFMKLTIKLLPEYIVLVLLLVSARVWLFPAFGVDDSLVWIFAMAIAGTLFVIPTAGEVPIVQAMFAFGVGVGPAAALIMTLPAVSLPSLVMLGKVFSLRIRLVIAIGVVMSGIAAGFIAKLVF